MAVIQVYPYQSIFIIGISSHNREEFNRMKSLIRYEKFPRCANRTLEVILLPITRMEELSLYARKLFYSVYKESTILSNHFAFL
jgi:hypothetical protein